MEHQGLRDVERWKDKIEVRLDNRQVAFLFFGSALCACMLFILGVIVGKRLESRGRAMAPEIEDPLTLLDRVAASSAPAPAAVEAAPAAVRARRAAPPPAESKAPVRPAEKVVPRPLAKAADNKPADKAGSEVADPVPPPVKPRPPSPVAREAVAVPAPAAEVPPAVPPSSPSSSKPRFMLQVGSFPMRAEADAFAGTFAGQNAVVVPWEVPGKGLWYRVRVGNYQSFKEAIDAKIVFEKKHNKIALVIGPL
jgi:DedD protein